MRAYDGAKRHATYLYSVVSLAMTDNAHIGALLLDRRSIDLSGAREKEGHFHYKNFLRASK